MKGTLKEGKHHVCRQLHDDSSTLTGDFMYEILSFDFDLATMPTGQGVSDISFATLYQSVFITHKARRIVLFVAAMF